MMTQVAALKIKINPVKLPFNCFGENDCTYGDFILRFAPLDMGSSARFLLNCFFREAYQNIYLIGTRRWQVRLPNYRLRISPLNANLFLSYTPPQRSGSAVKSTTNYVKRVISVTGPLGRNHFSWVLCRARRIIPQARKLVIFLPILRIQS